MSGEDAWRIMHNYRRAWARGIIETDLFDCPQCGSHSGPCIGKDEFPALKCLSCKNVRTLGSWDIKVMETELAGL